jgi:DNA invertase Pin-like site-specific DNA recombinase
MRLLSVIRLSSLTDETTSPERQNEQISLTAKVRGDSVTATAQDLDVSGAVDPFKRDGLGPWLTDPSKIAQWDGLMVAKLDRLSRSLLDFAILLKWCESHGKTIISVSEGIDFSTAMGRMFAQILIMFAEFERARMSERRAEAKVKLDQVARWGGGTLPYGYMKQALQGGGWELVPDPVTSAIVHECAVRVIAGESARSICLDLTARGIPTSTGKTRWLNDSLIKILRSHVLKGYVVSNGNIVRNSDGFAVRRQSVLTDEIWGKVQTALDAASQNRSTFRSDAAYLLHVAYCGECGSVMQSQRQVRGERVYAWYLCRKRNEGQGCTLRRIQAGILEPLVGETLLIMCGEVPMRNKIIIPAQSHAADLAAVDEAIEGLQEQLSLGKISADLFGTTASKLEARQAALKALPSTLESEEWIPTGQTFSQHWSGLDVPGKRAFMIHAGITARVHEDDGLPITPCGDRAFIRLAGGFKTTIFLGDLASLSELASQATQKAAPHCLQGASEGPKNPSQIGR